MKSSFENMQVGEGLTDIKPVLEVPIGTTAVLNCNSNDFEHNFMFWLFDKDKVIGPGNDFDEKKYKYEVLSGKLHINSVLPSEAGYYRCVSSKLNGAGVNVAEVKMLVNDTSATATDAAKLVAIVVSLIVIISCAVIYWRLRKQWNKYDGRAVVPVNEIDEEDNDDDNVYNSTTTSINHPVPGPSRNVSSEHLIYGIDNQGLDTDFSSVFENIQIKTPQGSLI